LFSTCLARSANLPEGLYILPMFFLYFFNGRHRSPDGSEANVPIFTKISRLVDGYKGLITPLSFFIFQGMLPWQPIKVEKSAFFPDQSTLSCCRSETECNIAISI